MTHALRDRLDQLSDQELDQLESVLGVVLHDAELRAEWLLTELGRQVDDWEGEDAVTTAWITILSKALGVDPPRGN
jgi:hypothetical protein